MKITVLNEDMEADSPSFLHEHGLSLYCETGKHKFLFDLGETDIFLKNANKLGIDISSVDFAVVSHAHEDHSGGLQAFFSVNHTAPVYLSSFADREFYVREGRKFAYAGLDREILERHAERFLWADKDTEIHPGIRLITKADRVYGLPKFCKLMVEKDGEGYKPDTVSHEVFLCVSEEDGLKVLTGCSHQGIRNIVESARRLGEVTALVGGFHLYGTDYAGIRLYGEPYRGVRKIASEIQDIQNIYTGHCTGLRAYRVLQKYAGAKYLNTGETYIV